MQKPVVFIAGVLVGAAAVVTLSAWWAPEPVIMAEAASPAGKLPAGLPDSEHSSGTAAGNDAKTQQPAGVHHPITQSASQHPTAGVQCPEPVEFTPAQLDELAEQRREQQYRQDLSNMHLSQPTAYAGKLLIFKDDTTYNTNVDAFTKAEAGGDWAERAQRVLQQYFDADQEEFQNVLVECRATICRINGKARAAEVFERYFSTPANSFLPALGMSPFGVYPHVIPNDKDLGFVVFKYKNDEDFKQK